VQLVEHSAVIAPLGRVLDAVDPGPRAAAH
jgi:hypothetical protein